MSFLGLLLIILLFFLLRPVFKMFMMYRKYRRAMREAYSRAQSAQGRPYGRGSQSRGAQNPAPKKKVFTKDMGEYVAYEEISCTITEDSTSQQTQTVTEEQVTDIEWEDIKE